MDLQVGVVDKVSATVEPTTATDKEGPRDLREFLAQAEAIGQLSRIKAEVDWDHEMGAITYMTGQTIGSPALLFENIKGHPGARSLWNLLGPSLDRIAIAAGLPTGMPVMEMIKAFRERLKRQIAPVEVDAASAPVNENLLLGDDVDVYRFAPPKHWPNDGGRYIGTADAIITRDPEEGWINYGTYRQMVQDRNHVGLYISPGKDGRLHLERSWQLGRPLEVAAVWGINPSLFMVASQGFTKTSSELDFAGGLQGSPLEVVKGAVTDLLIPARAEIVMEGVIYPNATKLEGPFGEFQGYYGRPEAETPIIEVKALHFRNNPIHTNALMADYPACEQNTFFSVIRSARIWDDLDRLGIPGIHGVYSHPAAAGGFGVVVISMEQRYAGHAPQVLALAAQCPGAAYYTKWIITVDEDVDPTDMNQVLWAMSTRCNPTEDIDILRQTWSTYLDPTQNPPEDRPWGSKALINACMEHRYKDVFSKRTRVARSMYEKVSARWSELGIPVPVPQLRSLEDK